MKSDAEPRYEVMNKCESLIKISEFTQFMHKHLDAYYKQRHLDTSVVSRGDREYDVRSTILIKNVRDAINSGSRTLMVSALVASLKAYDDFINKFSWVTGIKVELVEMDVYSFISDVNLVGDLELIIDYMILNEIFCNSNLVGVKMEIVQFIEDRLRQKEEMEEIKRRTGDYTQSWKVMGSKQVLYFNDNMK